MKNKQQIKDLWSCIFFQLTNFLFKTVLLFYETTAKNSHMVFRKSQISQSCTTLLIIAINRRTHSFTSLSRIELVHKLID